MSRDIEDVSRNLSYLLAELEEFRDVARQYAYLSPGRYLSKDLRADFGKAVLLDGEDCQEELNDVYVSPEDLEDLLEKLMEDALSK